ncbi:MAG TPA: hypothetical protein VN201_09880 [Roseateles sp.]|nr:hypothetical protein [Roseateles sp.]HWT55237.1 hypothetical protein [Rhodocyclaceae bacterium]
MLVCSALATGCSTPRGSKGSQFDPSQLGKADIDRMCDVHRAQIDASLKVLAEKLYKRNPREWKNAGQPNMESAVGRIFAFDNYRLPELGDRKGADAIVLGLREDYTGDRVAAYVAGIGSMVHQAFNEKRDFYLYDDVDPQRLYNAARNLEIAAWKLANSRDAQGQLLLLSNELYPVPNLSFEREFGKMIGNLDLLSSIVADKTNRSVVRVVQNVATAVFLPIGIH